MNKIQRYIKKNWKTLPKSTFNDTEVVIFDCVEDYDGGWGHHSYEGYGCLQDGTIVSATSGGCSCSGGCTTDAINYTVDKETKLKFDNYNPEVIDFSGFMVTFSDYGGW